MPDAACRKAAEVGMDMYQWRSVLTNISNYNDMAAVKTAIPDGTLCGAGKSNWAGLNVVAPWFRTDVEPTNGKMTVTWYATAPHTPSFFEYYLSKPGYDGSRPLRWDDLELLQKFPDTPTTIIGGKEHYVHAVPVPASRSGYAVLYSRWQREAGGNGEGFYSCSDINIIGGGGPPPFPWHPGEIYLKQGFAPKPDESVRFRVLSGQRGGKEAVDVTLPITAQNQSQYIWPKDLADRLNTSSAVRIGKRSGDQIVYDNSTLTNNLIYLKDQRDSTAMEIIPPDEDPPPPVARITGPTTVEVGKALALSGSESTPASGLRYAWTAPFFTPASATGSTASFTAPSSAGKRTIRLVVSDGKNRTDIADHEVMVAPAGADTEPPSTPGNFRVTATTDTTVSLAWDAATDNVRVTHYQIRNEGGYLVKTVGENTLTHTVDGLQPDTEYKYTVSARDKELNTSVYSPMITARTKGGGGGGDECDYRDPAADSADEWQTGAYDAGARVKHLHALWLASYSTGTSPPDQNDAWKLLSQIPVAWNASRAYEGGNQVHYEGQVYRAGWWIKGTAPPASPWTRVGPCQ